MRRIRPFLFAVLLAASGSILPAQFPPTSASHLSAPILSIWSQQHHSNNITDPGLFAGATLTVSVNLTEMTDFNVYTFKVYYDATRLKATGLSIEGAIFGPDAFPLKLDLSSPGLVDIGVFVVTPVSGSGVLVFIDFQVVGNGWSPLDIEDDTIGLGGGPIPHLTQDGLFDNNPLGPLAPDFSKPPVPGYYETSEYLAGKVVAGIIIVESTGSNYDWTDQEVNETITKFKQAMNWWAAQEPKAHISFEYDIQIRVPVSVEPIEMRIGDAFLGMEEAMQYLGYGTGFADASARSYINAIRSQFETDWAFVAFIADSDPGVGAGAFLDAAYEIATLGGPWFIMARMSIAAFNSGNYQVAVPAHAMGHIFYATDEYNGFPEYGGYLAAHDRDFIFGLMNRNDLKVSYSTRLQVGWRDTDGDGILDITDTFPSIVVTGQEALAPDQFRFAGATVEVPFRNSNPFLRTSVTINRMTSVEARIDGGPWLHAIASDGAFDEALENFTVATPTLAAGTHSVEFRATNSVGNTGSISQSLVVESQVTVTELSRWQARPLYHRLDLTKSSMQTFAAYVTNTGNTSVYVRIRVSIVDENNRTVIVTSESRLILQGESMTLMATWGPPVVSATYIAIVTLQEAKSALPGSEGWTIADGKSFRFTVAV